MSDQENLFNHFRESQQKYIYYLIALSVAAIGFSVINTKDLGLSYWQIPLGLAVISWVTSIFIGFKFLTSDLRLISQNYIYLSNYWKFNADQKEKLSELWDQISKESETQIGRLILWQKILFFSGCIFYLLWHIFQMYLNT